MCCIKTHFGIFIEIIFETLLVLDSALTNKTLCGNNMLSRHTNGKNKCSII